MGRWREHRSGMVAPELFRPTRRNQGLRCQPEISDTVHTSQKHQAAPACSDSSPLGVDSSSGGEPAVVTDSRLRISISLFWKQPLFWHKGIRRFAGLGFGRHPVVPGLGTGSACGRSEHQQPLLAHGQFWYLCTAAENLSRDTPAQHRYAGYGRVGGISRSDKPHTKAH
jgi:hypothetical protein